MSAAALLDELLEPLALCLGRSTAERVAAYRIAPSVQKRVDSLAELANELLSPDERAEYEALVSTAEIIGMLQLKAQRLLQMNW